jgi:hypothetical protein
MGIVPLQPLDYATRQTKPAPTRTNSSPSVVMIIFLAFVAIMAVFVLFLAVIWLIGGQIPRGGRFAS